MNPNFNFDAEGVFDQPIKPIRLKKRQKVNQHWRAKWLVLTDGKTLDARNIIPRFLGRMKQMSYKPPAGLMDEHLKRPRSAESEFGLKFVLK